MVAIKQQWPQAEKLDLLGVVLARQHRFQVHLHARFRGTPAKQAKGIAGKLGLGKERRQAGENQHGHGPWRKMDQQCAIADQRNQVLAQTEGACDQGKRATGGLASRPGELVVELRVLELGQLQGQCLLENHLVDAVAKLRPQQRLAQRQATLRTGQGCDQDALQDDPFEYPAKERVTARGHFAAGRHHGIDNLRAGPGDTRRHQACRQGQQRQRHGQGSAGAPYQLQGAAAEAEYTKKAARKPGVLIAARMGMSAVGNGVGP